MTIDKDGYRPNVATVISNEAGQVFWAQRAARDGWQFPQGGIKAHETPQQAMYRELYEEVGLQAEDVKILMVSPRWLRYRFPQKKPSIDHLDSGNHHGCYIGQKQIWFLLKLVGSEKKINLNQTDKPEFDQWCWVDYWYPLDKITAFKRAVYRAALEHFATALEQHTALQRL